MQVGRHGPTKGTRSYVLNSRVNMLYNNARSGLSDREDSAIIQRQEAEIGAAVVDAAREPLYLIRTFRE